MEELKQLITGELISPEHRASVKINTEHVTLLYGTKIKKQLSHKVKTQQCKTLTRKEYAKLGLFHLPTKQMKYEEGLPLHRLWKGYAREHLGLRKGDTLPEVYDPRYEAFSKLLVKMDLHGAKLCIIQSKCSTLVGLSGIVVIDTKNVLKLLGVDNRIRTIPKCECVFGMRLGNMEFTIFGKHLAIRPAERSVKKIKGCIEPFM